MKLKLHICSEAECGKAFGDRSSLIRHEKCVHGIFPTRSSTKKSQRRKLPVKKEESPEVIDLTDFNFNFESSPTSSLNETLADSREITCAPATPTHVPDFPIQLPNIALDPFDLFGTGAGTTPNYINFPQYPTISNYDFPPSIQPSAGGLNFGSFNPGSIYKPTFGLSPFFPYTMIGLDSWNPNNNLFSLSSSQPYPQQLGPIFDFNTVQSSQPYIF